MTNVLNFDGHFLNPGMGTVTEEVVNQFGQGWGAPFKLQYLPKRIDGAARDAGNTGFTDVLRPGLLLGEVASSGKLKQWDPDATDGTHKIAGILAHAMKMTFSGSNADRFTGFVFVGGSITARGLAQASSASYGIDGTAEEYNIRSQLYPGFVLEDDPMGNLAGKPGGVMIVAASATLSELHNGSLVVVRGATGTVTLTLPASPKRGLRYRIFNAVDQTLTLAAGAAGTMVLLHDLAANSISLSTTSEKIGGSFEVIGDGTGWLVIPSRWEAQTCTIAT